MFHKDKDGIPLTPSSSSSILKTIKEKRRERIPLLVYFLISIGVAFQISGADWDIVWHGLKKVESFLTPPHAVIYSGVVLTIGSVIFGLILFHRSSLDMPKRQTSTKRETGLFSTFKSLKSKKQSQKQEQEQLKEQKKEQEHLQQSLPQQQKHNQSSSLLPFPMKLAILGAIFQSIAGPFDYWWHSNFGFDGLLSPSHSVLVTGMLMAALGGLFGIYGYYKNNNHHSSHVVNAYLVISFGIFLMVAVGMIFLFTLPFSKGKYFDFNPQPFAAILAEITAIPFIMGLSLYSISSSSKMPFIYTFIFCVIIVIGSSTTIISNSYLAGLFPFYLLNILPALIMDIFLILSKNKKFSNNNNDHNNNSDDNDERNGDHKITNRNNAIVDLDKRYFVASILLSSFFVTLLFPWSIYVFYGFFKPSDQTRIEEFLLQILFPIILPVVIPISLISSSIGIYIIQKVKETKIKIQYI